METQLAALLEHYFRTAFEKAGLRWTGDNATEMQEIAALVVAIAEQAARDHTAR